MKDRLYLFVGAIIFVAIILVVYVATSSAPRTVGTYGKTLTCTLNAEVGASSITITNQKTGDTWQVLPMWLPYSFNFTSGDGLTFLVTAKPGYIFNVWMPNTGYPKSNNPYTVLPTSPFSLIAQFIPDQEYQP